MTSRKTNLSQVTKNLFNRDYEQETLILSPLKSTDKSKISSNYSPLKQDSIDNLLESQNSLKTQRPSEFSLRKMLSKIDNVDNPQEPQQQHKIFRFRRHDHFQSQPNLKIDVRNDIEDFFNNANDTPIKTQIQKNKECKIYKLVTFTDYVEHIYGRDWFSVPTRRPRRQNTIQEFFDVLE